MAKEETGGVWRTIGGRRVFIRDGQSLADAMKESGKFNTSKAKEGKPVNKAKEEADKYMSENYEKKKKEMENWLEKSKEIKGEDDTFKRATNDNEKDKEQKKQRLYDEATLKQYEEKYGKEELEKFKKAIDNYNNMSDEELAKEQAEFKQREKEFWNRYDNDEKFKEETNKEFQKMQKESLGKQYRNKLNNVAKNSSEDNVTLDTETGEVASFEKGYSVSFQQSSDNYSDREYYDKVEECRNKCDGKFYAGKYGGDPEASFHTDDIEVAKELMYKYNQESIYDWENGDLIYNDRYDASKNKTNFERSQDPYDDPESEESQRLQSVQSRYDEYLQKTEGRGASYGEIAYVDNLRGKDLDNFEKELDDFENKQANKKTKTTNQVMNEAIREKTSKKKTTPDLPKHVEIKEQGTSNRKEVSENVQAHILEYYDDPNDFIEQMENMNAPTMWHAGEELASGGSYAIYYGDQREFLDSLKINPKGKEFSDDRVFETYKSLIGRESARLYDRLKRNQYNEYKRQHPLSKMTFDEFKNQGKKG